MGNNDVKKYATVANKKSAKLVEGAGKSFGYMSRNHNHTTFFFP
jgi:hypothetical protein